MSAPFSPVPSFAHTPSPVLAVQRIIDTTGGGVSALIDRLHNGEVHAQIAKSLGLTRAELRRWAMSLPAAQQAELQDAEKGGAAALMEATIHIADATADNVEWDEASKPADKIKASAQRIGVRQFYAERIDRDKWSPRATTEVNLTFGAIFIDALRRRTRPEDAMQIPADIQTLPFREETLADFM